MLCSHQLTHHFLKEIEAKNAANKDYPTITNLISNLACMACRYKIFCKIVFFVVCIALFHDKS